MMLEFLDLLPHNRNYRHTWRSQMVGEIGALLSMLLTSTVFQYSYASEPGPEDVSVPTELLEDIS